MVNEKSLTLASFSSIVFPTLVVIMFPEGTIIYNIANILLTFFMSFLFIITVINACGQKEILEPEESYDIPLFEAFASSFGDEYAIVWKKTNELVDISGNNGKLSYSEAHHLLNDYLKHNPDRIWAIQIIPHVEIVTHILPEEEPEITSAIEEEESIPIVEVDKKIEPTVEDEAFSPIEEVIDSSMEDSEDILSTQDEEHIPPIVKIDEVPLEDVTENISETKIIEETIETEKPDEPVSEEIIKEIDTSMVEERDEPILVEEVDQIISEEAEEEIFSLETSEESIATEKIKKIPASEDPEKSYIEEAKEEESKTVLLSNIPSPYILKETSEEEFLSPEETEKLAEVKEESLPIKEIEEEIEIPNVKEQTPRVKEELLSNIPSPYILKETSGTDFHSHEKKDELSEFKEEILPKEERKEVIDILDVKEQEPQVKKELLSNIPSPYILSGKVEELEEE